MNFLDEQNRLDRWLIKGFEGISQMIQQRLCVEIPIIPSELEKIKTQIDLLSVTLENYIGVVANSETPNGVSDPSG